MKYFYGICILLLLGCYLVSSHPFCGCCKGGSNPCGCSSNPGSYQVSDQYQAYEPYSSQPWSAQGSVSSYGSSQPVTAYGSGQGSLSYGSNKPVIVYGSNQAAGAYGTQQGIVYGYLGASAYGPNYPQYQNYGSCGCGKPSCNKCLKPEPTCGCGKPSCNKCVKQEPTVSCGCGKPTCNKCLKQESTVSCGCGKPTCEKCWKEEESCGCEEPSCHKCNKFANKKTHFKQKICDWILNKPKYSCL